MFSPAPRATVLFGHNGQGKTNLLEAIHFLSEFRSFRTKRLADLVRRNQPAARLSAMVDVGGLRRKVDVDLRPPGKAIQVDGKGARRDSPSMRGASTVLFVPEDLLLPKAAPQARRSFLDRAIFGTDRAYWPEASAFARVLKSRNALLRQRIFAAPLLDTYDEELARTGARMVMRRRELVLTLAPSVSECFRDIHGDLALQIRYRSHATVEEAADEAQVGLALLRGLGQRRALDQQRGYSGFGPQTDDLEIQLDGHLLREHGSQGQMRSAILALKLAERVHIERAVGEAPLLLLDDVASELDEIRRGKLFESLASLSGQTILTVTDRHLLPALPGRQDFQVEQGRVVPA